MKICSQDCRPALILSSEKAGDVARHDPAKCEAEETAWGVTCCHVPGAQIQQLQSDVQSAKKEAAQAGNAAVEERCRRQAVRSIASVPPGGVHSPGQTSPGEKQV